MNQMFFFINQTDLILSVVFYEKNKGIHEISPTFFGFVLHLFLKKSQLFFFPKYFFLKIKRIINGTVTESESLRGIRIVTRMVKFLKISIPSHSLYPLINTDLNDDE